MKLKGKRISNYINILLILCIIAGVVLHIAPYLYNRSLWIDEAMLVSSICTRSFSELIASPLDWGQSAPIAWLFIVKFLSSVFGSSEAVLRVTSLISAYGCILLIFLLLKDRVKKIYALLFTAFFSLSDYYIYYGNEAKPYMWDNLCCLFALYVWQKYKEKRIKLFTMVIIYSALIWCSFSAVFFVAACMIIEGLKCLSAWIKDRSLSNSIPLGLCSVVFLSFVMNYCIWLSQTSDNAGGAEYWALLRFPLIPTSMSDIVLIGKMIIQFLAFFPFCISVIFIILMLAYIVECIKEKKDRSELVVPFLLSLNLLLLASYLGFYPIQDRLVQVYGILLLLFSGFGFNEIDRLYFSGGIATVKAKRARIALFSALTICLALIGMEGCKNIFPKHVYKYGNEVSKSYEYLQKNLNSNDKLYIFNFSIPVYSYLTGYEIDYQKFKSLPEDYNKSSHDLGLAALPTEINGTIYGQQLANCFYKVPYSYDYEYDNNAIDEDFEIIQKYESVYIFTSHGERGIQLLLSKLEGIGNVEKVVDFYYTHLYHFVKNEEVILNGNTK